MKLAIAWAMFVGGVVGFALSLAGLIAEKEPLTVLLLSWGALIYEGTNTLFITKDPQPGRKES